MQTIRTVTVSRPPVARRRVRSTVPVALAGLLLLAGCAGSKVETISMTPPRVGSVAPAAVRVTVTVAPELSGDKNAGKAAVRLAADLVKKYREVGLPILAATQAPAGPGTATVQVRITRADPGSRAQRMLIGFGAGKSVLRTYATFNIEGSASPVLQLTSSSNSGRKPGLILPGAIAAATSDATRLAIGGGVGVLFETRSGLGKDADRSASLIVNQTRQLYQTCGWRWPAAQAGHS